MDFIDQLRQFSNRVSSMKENILTEEATKTSIIMPFFSMLGYDVFNPEEFVPEYTADVGIKRGEKVDYAIIKDGEPAILIEVKSVNENLEKHDSQLFRYFGTTNAKLAILTNGIMYRFYTDLEETNKMDTTPFMEINILDIKEPQVPELKKFCKSVFSVDEISSRAAVLKYSNEFRAIFAEMLANPSDDIVKLFLRDVYSGLKTQSVIEKFRPILKKSLNEYISETMNDKIKAALGAESTESTITDSDSATSEPESDLLVEAKPVEHDTASKIVTTDEELEAFTIVKELLSEFVDPECITYKDTTNYFGILYKSNTRKWICRFRFTPTSRCIILPDSDKNEVRVPISSLEDIELHKQEIITALKRYME